MAENEPAAEIDRLLRGIAAGIGEINRPSAAGRDGAAAAYLEGLDLSRRGDPAGAVARYGEAIRLRPGEPRYLLARAMAQRLAGDQEGALADYGRAIELAPDDPDARYLRGALLLARGDREGARADLDAAAGLGRRPGPLLRRALLSGFRRPDRTGR